MSKVVVLTGANGGIGSQIFNRLNDDGHIVHACSRRSDDRKGIKQVDITKREEIDCWATEVRRHTESVDMLINSAGVAHPRGRFDTFDDDVWWQNLNVNLVGPIRIVRSFLGLLKNAAHPTVVNMGSVLGQFGRAGWGPYSVSKFALEGFGQVVSQELSADGVRVITLHPARIPSHLRTQVYPSESLAVEGAENLDNVVAAIRFILGNPELPMTGISLSANDFDFWSSR